MDRFRTRFCFGNSRRVFSQSMLAAILTALLGISDATFLAGAQLPDESPGQAQTVNQTESLFDGKTLAGWESDNTHWRVENGAIVGEIPPGQSLDHNTWLVLKDRQLNDFELNLKVKLTGAPAANSGIQFRCQVDHVDHVSGYQADLDQGETWLGRIYDEHGRALLVERGSRVHILKDGTRQSESFANAGNYKVLFRENAWNDYKLIAVGDRVAVYINGTLFSELWDEQTDAKDVQGSLAFQLHAGPETLVQFRDIQLTELQSDSAVLGPWKIKPMAQADRIDGSYPKDGNGRELNFGFESGDLTDWVAEGDAFAQQPLREDGISSRWPGQTSAKVGDFFIGGYEKAGDAGIGSLTSVGFEIDHPYASFLLGGGPNPGTRVELVEMNGAKLTDEILFQTSGNTKEQMQRHVLDLRPHQGKQVAVRIIDEDKGAWGHLNFDDFRFHAEKPEFAEVVAAGRSTRNPLLQHLVPNVVADADLQRRGSQTTAQMFVPEGFSADVIAAEPELHQPMAFTFDARGRLWVVEGHCYPTKRPEGEGLDKILIFSDEDGDGQFESRKVFIEGLNLVSGMEIGHGGVWVGAAPQLLFIPDADHDDVPDGEPQVLLDGFGFADTHETINSFMWGPDGWLYGNQGVFNTSRIGKPGVPEGQRESLSAGVWRYHPQRHVFEVFAHGGSNQWGLDYDEHGQIFMTHCRSYWGQGSTTHVIQNGHFWNQVNSNYAPFVCSTSMPFQPGMKNYLLASARYGHGEGGAGKEGSRAVYGGHSHVGTMIYLGDNWPDQYRNHLFTHNLHGHQMNHQINQRDQGGYNTVHAGYDMLLCSDPQFIGVDLQYGPDGAVYFSDWYDPRHCHNPDWEQWDRGNGRMYRLKFDANYHAAKVDYLSASDLELVNAQKLVNAWHGRTARLEMARRAESGKFSEEAVAALQALATSGESTVVRLNAIWALHGIGGLSSQWLTQLLSDEDEYIRSWAIQLGSEPGNLSSEWERSLTRAAGEESSLMVRRYLASAMPRMSDAAAWSVAEALSKQVENNDDRELPSLLWFGLAPRMEKNLPRAFELASATKVPVLRDFVLWYAAKLSNAGRSMVVAEMKKSDETRQARILKLMELGVRGMRGLKTPEGWAEIANGLYSASDRDVRIAGESLGAAFGDRQLFATMSKVLADDSSSVAAKRNALNLLAYDSGGKHLSVLLGNLDVQGLTMQVLPMLKSYQDPKVATELIDRYSTFDSAAQQAAMEVLCSRAVWSDQLLDAIAAGRIDKSQLTAFFVRQMAALGDQNLNAKLEKQWGKLGQTSAERKAEIRELATLYKTAPLWAYSENAGAVHFKKICATCHSDSDTSQRIAPRLEGTGSKGIDYIVENILDPNAVIGQDFQARLVLTVEGRLVSGLIVSQSDSAITIRTATGTETIAKEDIEEVKVSENSFMPEGLLKPLEEQERIELLKYLMSM